MSHLSCSKDDVLNQGNVNAKENYANQSVERVDITKSRNLLARLLAESLKDKGASQELRAVLARERDGDTEVLLAELVGSLDTNQTF